MNKYPLWKYILVLVIVIVALIYALPNVYGEDPALQVSSAQGSALSAETLATLHQSLEKAGIKPIAETTIGNGVLIRFSDEDTQSKAKECVQAALGKDFIVALNLTSASPKWLQAIGANPMKLGLDLRGGIHLLLQVDVNSVIEHRVQGGLHNAADRLREARIRYSDISLSKDQELVIAFRTTDESARAYQLLSTHENDYEWQQKTLRGQASLIGQLAPAQLSTIQETVIQQAIMTLRRRVNELGVSEPVVQQQGMDRISIDLPGVQDAARAQDLIGKTATLEFHLVDTSQDLQTVLESHAPLGSEIVYTREGHEPVLLQSPIILKGSAITSAYADVGQNGRPDVNIRLGGGGGEDAFSRVTADNVGRPMAVVYVDTQSTINTQNGKMTISYHTMRDVINVATIQQALGNSFQITNLTSMQEANDLALLLRAGSLPTTVTIIEEQTVGPSLGQANIHMGIVSVAAGLLIIIIFMAFYYGLFGVFADIGLIINLIFTVAIMSLLGAVLTLPGIAGMVLAVGMAVDANVLINERIREELRLGMSIAGSIKAGYERALSTIIDSNVTTLIAALILMSIGTGSVKGFAVTLTIGILTSMFTAVVVTRSIVNLTHGGRKLKFISIGLNIKRLQANLKKKTV